ncbi:MAG: lipocalin family protein [Chitinophagaceae bacterium]
MKQTFSLFSLALAFSIFLLSCGSTSHTVEGVNLNGNYVLNDVHISGITGSSVTTEQAGNSTATITHTVKINTLVFDDAAPDCFKGSTWTLPHNGYGSYTINGDAECGPGSRSIVWSIRTDANKQKIFQLKVTNGAKAKKVTTGYLLTVTNLTQSGFSLTEPITASDGSNGTVTFDFVRQ